MENEVLLKMKSVITGGYDLTAYYLKAASSIPNSKYPVIHMRKVFSRIAEDLPSYVIDNLNHQGWGNNWVDIIDGRCHYHSNTHEVLVQGAGRCNVVLGDQNGIDLSVETGDVLLVPAGVSHYSYSPHNYKMVGGYPNGEQWDMVFDEKVEVEARYPKQGIFADFFDIQRFWVQGC